MKFEIEQSLKEALRKQLEELQNKIEDEKDSLMAVIESQRQ